MARPSEWKRANKKVLAELYKLKEKADNDGDFMYGRGIEDAIDTLEEELPWIRNSQLTRPVSP